MAWGMGLPGGPGAGMARGGLGLLGGNPLGLLSALSGVLGMFGGNYDPMEELQKRARRMQGELPAEAGRLYRANVSSPAFAQAQGQVGMASQGLTQRLKASLGARGLESSGVGAVAGALAPATHGLGQANLYSQAWGNAMDMAQQSLGQRYGIAGATMPRDQFGMYSYGGRDRLAILVNMLSKLPLFYGQGRQ